MRKGQCEELVRRVAAWRKAASAGGTLHGLWECIFDAEALLAGKKALLTVEQLLAIKDKK